MISILWNFWKLVLWPSIWHVLEDIPCLLEKNVWAAAIGVFFRGALRSSWLVCCSHLLFPYWPLFIFMGSASKVWGIIFPFCRWGNLQKFLCGGVSGFVLLVLKAPLWYSELCDLREVVWPLCVSATSSAGRSALWPVLWQPGGGSWINTCEALWRMFVKSAVTNIAITCATEGQYTKETFL